MRSFMTKRLVLREWAPSDAPDVFEYAEIGKVIGSVGLHADRFRNP